MSSIYTSISNLTESNLSKLPSAKPKSTQKQRHEYQSEIDAATSVSKRSERRMAVYRPEMKDNSSIITTNTSVSKKSSKERRMIVYEEDDQCTLFSGLESESAYTNKPKDVAVMESLYPRSNLLPAPAQSVISRRSEFKPAPGYKEPKPIKKYDNPKPLPYTPQTTKISISIKGDMQHVQVEFC
jgi:hypothetical protein